MPDRPDGTKYAGSRSWSSARQLSTGLSSTTRHPDGSNALTDVATSPINGPWSKVNVQA